MAITISRTAQINAAGADDALNLKQFGGEILVEYERSTVFKDKHFMRTIQNGKSAQFPMIGVANVAYKTPGVALDGQVIKSAEKVITIDGLLTASVSIEEIDEAMLHYDIRGPYTKALGTGLGKALDQNIARAFVLAARAASPLTGRSGGSRIININMKTDGAVLEDAIWEADRLFDEKDVPDADRRLFLKTLQYNLLARRPNLISKDYGTGGNVAKGILETVADITLVKSNNVPQADDTANAAIHTKYRADYSTTAAVVATPMAAGTVQLMGLSAESDYEIREQGTFFVAKLAVGHDYLRPDCAIELATA